MSQRDMSYQEFKAAAARNGFEPVAGGLWLADKTIPSGSWYGSIASGGRIRYRDSLAKAIRERAAELALGQKVIKLRAQGKTDEQIMAETKKTKLKIEVAAMHAENFEKAKVGT